MINKKLLSEVLDKEVDSYTFTMEFKWCANFLSITFENGDTRSINIYELADKCKEWAYDNGCMLRTNYENTIDGKLCCVSIARVCKFNESGNWFYSTYEPEAVFKACEYIYAKLLKDRR